MKKIIAFCFVLLASLACGSYASAASAKVDLQVRNAYIQKFTDGNSQYEVEFLYVVVQNNGPDNFNGTFSISASNGSRYGKENFTGKINSGQSAVISVVGSPTLDPYSIYVDCNEDVPETNESNNYLYFVRDEPQVGIVGGWSGNDARYSNDTLWVLPGEYIYSQFSLMEFNQVKSIIGISYSIYSYDFAGNSSLSFWIQHYSENSFNNGTYSFKDKEYYYNYYSDNVPRTTFNWMANSNESALSYWWLGDFDGENNPSVVGEVKNIYINLNVALMYPGAASTTSRQISLDRSIKTIDRIRGDVNDDGVVDQKDVDILVDVVANNLYNPCQPTPNIYQEKGLNYGAGIVLFSRPDFVSNCLLNIWIHDKTDPLVQGLGIGEMMSNTTTSVAVEKIANTYSIVGDKIEISAPGANMYQITAQMPNGSVFQKTGQLSDTISIPDSVTNCNVQTINFKNEAFVTSLFGPKSVQKDLMSVYSTKFDNQLEISGSGILTIVNLRGQQVFSGKLERESLSIQTADWTQGMYIAKIIADDGHMQTTKLIK